MLNDPKFFCLVEFQENLNEFEFLDNDISPLKCISMEQLLIVVCRPMESIVGVARL